MEGEVDWCATCGRQLAAKRITETIRGAFNASFALFLPLTVSQFLRHRMLRRKPRRALAPYARKAASSRHHRRLRSPPQS